MKPWMIVAIALIASGGLLFCVAMSALGWDFSKLTTAKYEENRHDISEDFQNIIIIRRLSHVLKPIINLSIIIVIFVC